MEPCLLFQIGNTTLSGSCFIDMLDELMFCRHELQQVYRSHTPELEYTQRMLKSMGLKVSFQLESLSLTFFFPGPLAEERGVALRPAEPQCGCCFRSSQPCWYSRQDHLPQGHRDRPRLGLHQRRWELPLLRHCLLK